MPNSYAPVPKFDQYVEYVTQAKSVDTKDGAYCDVVINPASLDGCDLENTKTLETLVIAFENVVSMERKVTQKDVDTLKAAITKNGMVSAAIVARLNDIKATPVAIREEPLQDEPVIKLP